MLIRVGCEFCYESAWATPAVMQVEPRADGDFRILHEEWQLTPSLELRAYRDMYGNTCRRMVIPAGEQVISYDATVQVSGLADDVAPDAVQLQFTDDGSRCVRGGSGGVSRFRAPGGDILPCA